MEATCLANNAIHLPPPISGEYLEETRFPLTVGAKYRVYAVGVWVSSPQLLVRADNGDVEWCPAVLFDLELSAIPSGFVAAVYTDYTDGNWRAGGWRMICGPASWVQDEEKMLALAKADPIALRAFDAEFPPDDPATDAW